MKLQKSSDQPPILTAHDNCLRLYPHEDWTAFESKLVAKADAVSLTALSPAPDFRLVAESCRAWAETVSDEGDLASALDRALAQVDAGRQAVLDIHIV